MALSSIEKDAKQTIMVFKSKLFKVKRELAIAENNLENFIKNPVSTELFPYEVRLATFAEIVSDLTKKKDKYEKKIAESQDILDYYADKRAKKAALRQNTANTVLEIPELENFLFQWKTNMADYYAEHPDEIKGDADKVLDEVVNQLRTSFFVKINEKINDKIIEVRDIKIAENGVINAYIIGEKDNYDIRTIIAGGWNIQKLHFRVLTVKYKKTA